VKSLRRAQFHASPDPFVKRPTTLKDIARSLGVSTMTVSRAINGHPSVSDETRRLVMEKASKSNYTPNRWARGLVTNRSHLIGLVVPDISHAFYAEITLGIQNCIEEKGYNLLLCNSGRDPVSERREIDALIATRVEGLIVASSQAEESAEYFAGLKQQGQVFVLIDRYFRRLNCSCLVTDDVEVGRIATEHLIELGHRKIAHVRGPGVSPARLREEGYLEALRGHGLAENEAWMVDGKFRVEDSYGAMKILMGMDDRPTAVFAASDYSAFGVVQACRDVGVRVPEDVSVIGAGNIEGSRHPNAFLSTVDWDRQEMGREAGKVLLELIEERSQKLVKKVFAPHLLVRQSTAVVR
jgi:LacI family transcriptional regulator